MPDISMCKNKKCKLRESCYRFKAVPNPYRQAYATFKPVKDKCSFYWSIKEEK